MTSRREFLQTTALVAALPIAARVGLADAHRTGLVVFDRRVAVSRRFGARAEAAHRSVRGIAGDITELWVQELSPRWTRWSEDAVPIVGLTTRSALFCLERLGWDHRMRVVCHLEHAERSDGGTAHSVRIPARGLGIRELDRAGELWPEVLADRLTDIGIDRLEARGPSGASMAAADDDETVLHSWIIAPVHSRARATG